MSLMQTFTYPLTTNSPTQQRRVVCKSPKTCHLSVTPIATYPPSADSTTMHKRVVCKNQQTKLLSFLNSNMSNTTFDPRSPVHQEAGFLQWHTQMPTHTHTAYRHGNFLTESTKWANSVKIVKQLVVWRKVNI